MTAKELHQLALARNATLAHAVKHGTGLTLRAFRRWLDHAVDEGLLVKHNRRYYLTDDGWWSATVLNDVR